MENILTQLADDATKINYNDNAINKYIANQGGTTMDNRIIAIINAVIGVLGLVAVIVIIIGGVQYMTSSGDAGKVKKAKDTILYGIIGLIIVILAFAIVNFVITNFIG